MPLRQKTPKDYMRQSSNALSVIPNKASALHKCHHTCVESCWVKVPALKYRDAVKVVCFMFSGIENCLTFTTSIIFLTAILHRGLRNDFFLF